MFIFRGINFFWCKSYHNATRVKKMQDFPLLFTANFATFSESSKFFIQREDRIGGTYKKALYVEYTDDTFNTPKNHKEDELHLGSLGPVIRGEVGDTIEVVFQNKVRFTSPPTKDRIKV